MRSNPISSNPAASGSDHSKRRRLRMLGVAGIAGGALMMIGASSASADTPGNTSFYDSATHAFDSGTHCYQGLPHTDLVPTTPPSGATASFTGSALLACSPPVNDGTQQSTLQAGTGTLHVWAKNAGKKDCYTRFFLAHNATRTYAPRNIVGTGAGYGNAPYVEVPANTTKEVVFDFNVPQTALVPGDQITLWIDVRTASGPCSSVTLYYNSPTRETYVNIPPITTP